MAHGPANGQQQGGLKGALPFALVRGEEVGLGIARQVFGAKTLGGASSSSSSSSASSIQVASAARIYRSTNQSITTATLTAFAPATLDFDSDSYWAVGNPTRLTAPRDGKYTVGCSVLWDTSIVGTRSLYVVKNGVTGTRLAGEQMAAATGDILNVSTTLNLIAGDYVEFYVNQTSGGSVNVVATEQISQIWIAQVGTIYVPRIPCGCTWTRRGSILQIPASNGLFYVPRKSIIKGVSLLTEGSVTGSCQIDIWKIAFGSYPPTSGNSIVGSNPPKIVSGVDYRDTTLTGWTTSLAAGDTIKFNLVSTSLFTQIVLQLHVEETSA